MMSYSLNTHGTLGTNVCSGNKQCTRREVIRTMEVCKGRTYPKRQLNPCFRKHAPNVSSITFVKETKKRRTDNY